MSEHCDCMECLEDYQPNPNRTFIQKMLGKLKGLICFLIIAILTIFIAAVYGIVEAVVLYISRVYMALADYITFEG